MIKCQKQPMDSPGPTTILTVNSSLTTLLQIWPERDGTGDRAGSRKKKPTV
jgi:hypothetical protein